jgi:hypothetical protein
MCLPLACLLVPLWHTQSCETEILSFNINHVGFVMSNNQNQITTIWGVPDTIKEIAPGIDFVTTPSHGGYILSPERYAQMPDNLRQCSFTGDNHFEEDCSWCAVVLAWPELFKPYEYQAACMTYDAVYANGKRQRVSGGASVVLAVLVMLFSAPVCAADSRILSPDDYARMTRETPYRMDCPYVESKGYHDCGEVETYEAPVREDYLPAVVPEQTDSIPPLMPTLVSAVETVCRKVGKNSEYCTNGGNFGAADILSGMGE